MEQHLKVVPVKWSKALVQSMWRPTCIWRHDSGSQYLIYLFILTWIFTECNSSSIAEHTGHSSYMHHVYLYIKNRYVWQWINKKKTKIDISRAHRPPATPFFLRKKTIENCKPLHWPQGQSRELWMMSHSGLQGWYSMEKTTNKMRNSPILVLR